ncbi:glycerol-3-phosphate acyltransferase [Geomonas paludis]|uniref:Glycerol-3-phosphate acyltransferase n=1 Tax=Geomonas paludis TaxID=2740185 RepID=A0A6V8MXP4_9BACT|nr:glycerol-3-phosphate acyltransferase [Geomonas paludis]UPU34311.1 glycerol-3-phosphate acyltransferase [Geomonas paludis]GFO64293.1 acyl-phosphate glycerol 3-phosphate acyltransferase [Geomonas paludis]
MEKVPIIVLSYLLGCFTTGYYLVRLATGDDIRTVSSGNVGSRNVGRLLGAKGFVATFAGDAGKGFLVVWLARHLSPEIGVAQLALLAAVCGHVWPIQLRWRGGKGLATLAGGMILLHPFVIGTGFLLCLLLYVFTRSTTKSALIALILSPLFQPALSWYQQIPIQIINVALYTVLVCIVLYAHRSNIRSEFRLA